MLACSRAFQAMGLSVLPLLIKSLMYLDTKRVKSYLIFREILAAFAGPGMAVIFGYLLHYYGWRICYLLIAAMYLLALAWFYFKLAEVNLGDGHSKSLKSQLVHTLSIFRHHRLVLLIFASILMMSMSTFIGSVYAFVFLHDFHVQVYYVGYVPLLITIGGLMSLLLIPLQNKISKYKLIIFFQMMQIIIVILFWLFSVSVWITLATWVLLACTVGICYIYFNELMAKMAKELHMTVQLNTLYYFLRNFIPLIAVLVWTHFGKHQQVDMIAEILFLWDWEVLLFLSCLKMLR